MKYSCHTTVDLPRERMIALFDDPGNLPKWQDGFISVTRKQGQPGQPGATSHIIDQLGKRQIEMRGSC